MELKQLVEALDAQILQGDIVGAFEKFAADNCTTYSSPADVTNSKAQKLEALRWFFNNVATTNRIELIAGKIGKNTTDSQFLFDFSDRYGNPMVYSEVIRRTWKNGKLVEEQYLIGHSIDLNEGAPSEAKAPVAKPAKPVAKTAKTAEKAPEAAKTIVAAEKAPKAAKTLTPPAKTDDLVLIEGIGPKIAELLHKAGIISFAQLADTKPAAIKAILEAAGKRYLMHDPTTWPKQAGLARDGKTAELQKLQDKLKAGK